MDLIEWDSEQRAPELRDGGIDVWLLRLDREDQSGTRLAMLSPDERATAARKRSPLDARRYAAGRAGLRAILGRYLAVPAAGLRLRTEPLGRTVLAEPADLAFSVAHSDGVGLIAVSSARALGIDVESMTAAEVIAEVADHYLPQRRLTAIQAGSAAQRDAEYVGLWTEVEARAKVDGRGLGDLDPTGAAGLLDRNLNVVRFGPTDSHVATLAYSGPAARLSYRAFDTAIVAGSPASGAD